jgi:regulator of nucleoside diphosphate kinase
MVPIMMKLREANAIVEPAGVMPAIAPRKSKENLVISSFDKHRLMKILLSPETSLSELREELEDLTREIERGSEVRPQEMPADVVTMNSRVRVTDVESETTQEYTIVFPGDADYEKGRISILAPLGTALLGYRVGNVVNWHVPRGVRQLRIEEIVYQPEAAGDFHL